MDRDPSTITPGFNPLYAQVRQRLVAEMVSGRWTPGMALPTEQELAAELGVSQGTVRKALGSLAQDNLIVKVQGKGTFVAEPRDQEILFKFYRLTPDSGHDTGFPQSQVLSRQKAKPSPQQRDALALDGRATIWAIKRIRFHENAPAVLETVAVPKALFPDLGERPDLPNNLYQLFGETYGQTVARVDEQLKAVAAEAEDKQHLGCRMGTPLLQIDRVAFGLDGTPVEHRSSRCLTELMHYRASLK